MIFNGKNLKISIYGESHAKAVGVKVWGFPKFTFCPAKLDKFMERRKSAFGFSTERKEPDVLNFFGVKNNTVNNKFSCEIKNTDVKKEDYKNLYGKPRPSHADYSAYIKYGTLDFSGGGKFSGRLTAPLCVVGGICKQYLENLGIKINAYVESVGSVKGLSYCDKEFKGVNIEQMRDNGFPSLTEKENMIKEIENVKACGDSVGAKIECVISGICGGIGDAQFCGLDGKISSLIFAIPAVKGIEFGKGFDLTKANGSSCNDQMYYDEDKNVNFYSNNMGGINGGISNGQDITFAVAIKPTPSIGIEQKTVDLVKRTDATVTVCGRHDACIGVRAVPVVESAVAIALLDEILG